MKQHPDVANEVLFSCMKCTFVTVNRSKFDLHQLHHELNGAPAEGACEGEVVDEGEAVDESDEYDDDEILIKFLKF